MTNLLEEVAQNEKPIRTIDKEGFNILIESRDRIIMALIATQDLKILRNKMTNFLDEFEDMFDQALDTNVSDTSRFYPAKVIVKKYFE